MRRTLLRSAVGSVVVAGLMCASAGDAAAQAPPSPAPSDAVGAPDAVFVRIESPDPVILEAQQDGKWQAVCASPCGKPLSPKLLYRITGDELKTSEEFHLTPGKVIKLEVEPATRGGRTGGIVLIAVGLAGLLPAVIVTAVEVVALFGGLILICPFVAAFSKDQSHGYSQCLGDIATDIGVYYGKPYVWIPAAAGGLLALGGLAWLGAVGSSTTKVTQQPVSAPNAAARGYPAAWRTPEWNAPVAPQTKASAVVPLVDLAF